MPFPWFRRNSKEPSWVTSYQHHMNLSSALYLEEINLACLNNMFWNVLILYIYYILLNQYISRCRQSSADVENLVFKLWKLINTALKKWNELIRLGRLLWIPPRVDWFIDKWAQTCNKSHILSGRIKHNIVICKSCTKRCSQLFWDLFEHTHPRSNFNNIRELREAAALKYKLQYTASDSSFKYFKNNLRIFHWGINSVSVCSTISHIKYVKHTSITTSWHLYFIARFSLVSTSSIKRTYSCRTYRNKTRKYQQNIHDPLLISPHLIPHQFHPEVSLFYPKLYFFTNYFPKGRWSTL